MKKKGVSAHVYITNNKIQVLTGSCVKNKLQVVNFYEEPLEDARTPRRFQASHFCSSS